jgi:lipopolysaccharide transport system permease protein
MKTSTYARAEGPEAELPWDIVITPHRGWFNIPFREIWKYRELLFVLVYRDYKQQYKQTIFGSAWHIVQPIMQTILFTVVFSKIARISTEEIPPFLFFYSGILCWGYFQSCVTKTAATFSSNAYLFEKIYFPRLIVPLSQVFGNLFGFALNFVTFLVFYFIAWFGGAPITPDWRIVVLPVLLFQMAAMGLGIGCIVSSVTTRWRDLGMLIPTIMQIWMYLSCIAYPLSQVPEAQRWMFYWNPIVPVIEGFRFAFMGRGTVELSQIVVGFVLSLVTLILGLMVFHRVEKTSMDSV